jgi:hypothetical protein
VRTWERDDHNLTRPIAVPLDRRAELFSIDLALVPKAGYPRPEVDRSPAAQHSAEPYRKRSIL